MSAPTRKVPITLWVHTEIEVPADYDDEATQFYVEENHCTVNVLEDVMAEEAAHSDRGECGLCSHAGQVLGHVVVRGIGT